MTELRAIADPVTRAAACQTFIVNGRATLKAVEALRDESIRTARQGTKLTVDALAAAVGVKRNVIVEALRSLRPLHRLAGPSPKKEGRPLQRPRPVRR